MEKSVSIPYEDYQKIMKDSADKENIVKLLNTEFPDDTCQLIAIKSVLGIEVEKEEEPAEPTDTDTGGSTDPTDPPTP